MIRSPFFTMLMLNYLFKNNSKSHQQDFGAILAQVRHVEKRNWRKYIDMLNSMIKLFHEMGATFD